ncbi:penicillin-binding protein 2 [uncultured Alistipes sp.]|uniref:penicillin-binding protein 2 n=1 Tax=uncultured Alistipes sp. TaxID=538949 RepID=UPI0025DCB459|nr:penicillin-binding protein 2 [uncultured Alistipes sp.]
MSRLDDFRRMRTLQFVVLLIFSVIGCRLFYLQILDTKYKRLAEGNALRHEVQYPPRGEVFDRNGEYLVKSKECYDLMVVWREMDRAGFDTMRMCSILNLSKKRLMRKLADARMSPRKACLVTNFVSKEDKLRFDACNFKGFFTVYRTVREYPRKVGGNLLGYVGEVNQRDIDRDDYYRMGDYIGKSGVESAYEEVLRGTKGVKITEVDTHGATKGSYMEGRLDTLPEAGKYIVCTIDARLQKFCEELMEGKIGAAVAIEPATGEILMMVSSPTYDPDELVGRERGNHYMQMLGNKRRPLFNRAVSAKYPPGSTFKLVQGLVGMQEGVLTPANAYPCHGGYSYGSKKMKCHPHPSPLDLRNAVANSCNAYFCYVLRNVLDNPRYGSVKEGFDVWEEYVKSFGFGRKLDSDFNGEGNGYVPDRGFYDKRYRGSWNSLTVISLSIGQGELGCTPLQMANLAAIIANRGYYYIPHIVKRIEGRDSIDRRFYERRYTKVDPRYFEPVVEGMWRGVHVAGTSRMAFLPGLDVCGKTGTAQNPHGRDHSTFLSFAPKDNPKIAISVYVENAGFGASAALPIASLLEEFYLTDTITRPELVERVKQMQIYYPSYAK